FLLRHTCQVGWVKPLLARWPIIAHEMITHGPSHHSDQNGLPIPHHPRLRRVLRPGPLVVCNNHTPAHFGLFPMLYCFLYGTQHGHEILWEPLQLALVNGARVLYMSRTSSLGLRGSWCKIGRAARRGRSWVGG